MKNSIRIFILAACCVSAVLFSSCKKEQHNALKVSIESPASTAKAHLVDYYPNFIEGDQIKVNGVIYQSQEAGTTCEFWAIGDDDAESPYYAVYPASCVNGNVTAQPSIILPEVQHYVAEGDVQKLEAPMGGANTEPLIRFHNFCSVIEVAVKNPTGAPVSVTSVEVSSPEVNLSYPDGLALNTALDTSNPNKVQQLVANTTYRKTNDSDPDQGGVTLEVGDTNGSIAPNSSKSFLVYVPTYKHGDGSQMVLHVKVTAVGTDYLASYTRSVRLDSLQRNIVYHYNFSLSESIRKVEDRFFNVGSESEPDYYIAFTKNNKGAQDQKNLGTSYTSYSGTDVLTSAQWNILFAKTGKSGLVRQGNKYYWALLPQGFEYPEDYDSITAATPNNKDKKYTVTILDDKGSTTVTEYVGPEWDKMEAAGAVFLPINVNIPQSPTANVENKIYTSYYVPSISKDYNVSFYFYYKGEYKNNTFTLKSFYIQASVNNKDATYSPYYVRTIQNMNLTNK